MSAAMLYVVPPRIRCGLKGPGAPQWLAARGIEQPAAPNSWLHSAAAGSPEAHLLVARLGTGEFFIEDESAPAAASSSVSVSVSTPAPASAASGPAVDIAEALESGAPMPGVYPVLREDAAFIVSGAGACDVFAQICGMDFRKFEAAAAPAPRPLVMTLMAGVAVLVIPQATETPTGRYRIWCDPTYGGYLGDTLRTIVIECGGTASGETV